MVYAGYLKDVNELLGSDNYYGSYQNFEQLQQNSRLRQWTAHYRLHCQ
jgi:hypothetical protein